jgi:hypothetical protein
MNARTTNVPYTQAASQWERAELLAQDRLHAVAKPVRSGSREAVLYPRLPPSSPWSGADIVPVEAPLGYSVEALK